MFRLTSGWPYDTQTGAAPGKVALSTYFLILKCHKSEEKNHIPYRHIAIYKGR